MKYKIPWTEWNDIPVEKKKEFWNALGVESIEGYGWDSAQYIPTLIELLSFIDWKGIRKKGYDGNEGVAVLERGKDDYIFEKELVDALWKLTKVKLGV